MSKYSINYLKNENNRNPKYDSYTDSEKALF